METGGGRMEKVAAMDVAGNRRVAAPATTETEPQETARLRTAEMLLRFVPMVLSLAALLVMLKNKQTTDGVEVTYSEIGGFKYLVYANAVCAGYSLLSALFIAVPRCTTKSRNWAFFLFDQVLTYLILAAGTICTEVMYLAYNGDLTITWSEACSNFGSFCTKATASVGITFAAVLCYILLSLRSSYRLFSTFDAPSIISSAKRVEAAASPFSG